MRDEPLVYTITPGTREGVVVIKLTGPLTLANMFGFQGEIRAIQPALAIFDLSESEFMDSAGLGVLVNFYTSATSRGRKMALAGVNGRIEALLDMTHVKSLLRVYPTVAEAEAAAF
jgi:anti-sigma B factor antagonist